MMVRLVNAGALMMKTRSTWRALMQQQRACTRYVLSLRRRSPVAIHAEQLEGFLH
jgi:hypothetical protein